MSNDSNKNYKKYLKGKEKLKYAVIGHPTGDAAFDFLKKNLNRHWVTSFDAWQKSNYSK